MPTPYASVGGNDADLPQHAIAVRRGALGLAPTVVEQLLGVVRDIAERCRQTMITDGSCGMRELKAWVLSTMITKDPYESALTTVIASASADPDNRADLISTCLEKQFTQ